MIEQAILIQSTNSRLSHRRSKFVESNGQSPAQNRIYCTSANNPLSQDSAGLRNVHLPPRGLVLRERQRFAFEPPLTSVSVNSVLK